MLNKKELINVFADKIPDDVMCEDAVLIIHDAEKGTFTLSNVDERQLPRLYKGLARAQKQRLKEMS